jgi:hypothetical protein
MKERVRRSEAMVQMISEVIIAPCVDMKVKRVEKMAKKTI